MGWRSSEDNCLCDSGRVIEQSGISFFEIWLKKVMMILSAISSVLWKVEKISW